MIKRVGWRSRNSSQLSGKLKAHILWREDLENCFCNSVVKILPLSPPTSRLHSTSPLCIKRMGSIRTAHVRSR